MKLAVDDIFLWAYRFAEGRAASLSGQALPANLEDARGWLWAHFTLSDQRARTFISGCGALPGDARALLAGEDCPPRILFSGAWAYGVLPDFEMEFDGRFVGVGRLRFAFDERRLITVRRHALQVIHDVHRRLATGRLTPQGPLQAFAAINTCYCETAEDQLDRLADELNRVEDHVLAPGAEMEAVSIGPLRQDLSRRHRELGALRTAYHRATTRHGHHGHPAAGALPTLIQHADDAYAEIAGLQDRARLIHEEIDTKINGATNRTLHALTVMTALLMPPTLIVGAFGMNLHGVAFAESSQGFLLACGLCAAAVAVVYFFLKKSRILR